MGRLQIFNKDRVNQNREFFRIPEEEVINFLELVPGEDVTPKSESFEDKVDEVAFETQSRIGLKFNFLSADIKKGSILTFLDDESVTSFPPPKSMNQNSEVCRTFLN